MDHNNYKITSSVIGGSDTTYGCKRCGMVVWSMELHDEVFHAQTQKVIPFG